MGDLPEPPDFDDRDNEPRYPLEAYEKPCTESSGHAWAFTGAYMASHCYCLHCGADGD